MDTDTRIAAVRRRLREIQTDEAAAARAGRPCTQCVFGPINGSGQGKCDHIAHWQRRHDPLNGRWRGRLDTTTAEARSEDGLCGPEGLLFQPYSLKGKVFRWLSQQGPFVWLLCLMTPLIVILAVILTVEGKW